MAAHDSTPRRRTAGGRRNDAAAWEAYRSLGTPAQRLFGLLRTLPGPDQSLDALAAATAMPPAETAARLAALDRAGLAGPGPNDRYRVTPLGAALRPEWIGTPGRAIHRWYEWNLVHVIAAADLLHPQALRLDHQADATVGPAGFATAAKAAAWLDRELGILHAGVLAAVVHALPRYAWQLADGLRGYAWQRPSAVDWVAAASAAVAASRYANSPRASAAAYLCLADAYFLAGELGRAEEACTALGAHASEAGWLSGRAASFANRAGINHRRGDLSTALIAYQQAFDLYAAAGRPASQAAMCNHIGAIHLAQDRPHQAQESHRRALVLFRQFGSLTGTARTLESLAHACAVAGDRGGAERSLVQALVVYGRLGDRLGEARTRAAAAELTRSAAARTAA